MQWTVLQHIIFWLSLAAVIVLVYMLSRKKGVKS